MRCLRFGKMMYSSRKEARAVCRRMAREGRGRTVLDVYRCWSCDRYHIGNKYQWGHER